MVQTSSTVQSAAQYFRNKGGVVVNSAGNTGAYSSTAASDSLVSVSATDAGDNHASWSTYGPYVDLSAPGVSIWTTAAGGGYSAVSGTSFSSPLTAGVIALMFAANPSLQPATVVSLLESTAVDLGTPGYDQYYGYGRVDAAAAVQAAKLAQPVDTQPPVVTVMPLPTSQIGGVVDIDVSASDNVGVSRVDLLINGSSVASDATSPYAFSWDTSQLPDGTATIGARAYDTAGNSSSAAPVVVTIANSTGATAASDNSPPAVSISNPKSGSLVNGVVSIQASATDNVGVSVLTILLDGVVQATANSGSLSYRWNSKKASKGTHQITAVAKDRAGNVANTTVQVLR
jgi:hypothetical protein